MYSFDTPNQRHHSLSYDDFKYCSELFQALAERFKRTGVSMKSFANGGLRPYLTPEDQAVFVPMLRQTLLQVLEYMQKLTSIDFNRYSDCGVFCKFILAARYYEQLKLESPKLILMMQCGVFVGSYRLKPLQDDCFYLNYAGLMRRVHNHCFIVYAPTMNGVLDEMVKPRVIDVLTESDCATELCSTKSVAEYIQDSCASIFDSKQLSLRLHCEVFVNEKLDATYKINRLSGRGLLMSKICLFSASYSDGYTEALSREMQAQIDAVKSSSLL